MLCEVKSTVPTRNSVDVHHQHQAQQVPSAEACLALCSWGPTGRGSCSHQHCHDGQLQQTRTVPLLKPVCHMVLQGGDVVSRCALFLWHMVLGVC